MEKSKLSIMNKVLNELQQNGKSGCTYKCLGLWHEIFWLS
jgi:hypothetical protein